MNERAYEIFGDSPVGDLHNRIKKYAVPEEQDRLTEAIQIAQNSPATSHVSLSIGSFERMEPGAAFANDILRAPFMEYPRIFVVTSDTTEAVQALQILETAVSDRTRELSTVLDVSHRIASTLELEPLLHLDSRSNSIHHPLQRSSDLYAGR